PLFDAVDTLKACIGIYCKLMPHIKINKKTMRNATLKGFLNATDLADYLASKGMPFREAHHCVGRAVGFALSKNKELHELTLKELKGFSSSIEEDIFPRLIPEEMISRRKSFGGTATNRVKDAIHVAEKRLTEEDESLID
ncbi:argininosuccinate lyase, partial [Thermodesulfobacteriota bacterium]